MSKHSVRLIEDAKLKEKYVEIKHPSGLTVYVYPKSFTTSYAMLSARYGSLERTFCVRGEAPVTVPDGVAHFLEHKLFEEEDGSDVFERFAEVGANANAFTSHEMTSYLFSTADAIERPLDILLSFVTHPYFTPENVQKEQGIIGQEIGMYDDRPASRLYHAILEGLYQNHGVRVNIAGTVKTIAEITPEVLYRCYRAFYHPSNMILTVSGNVSCDEVMEAVDRAFGTEEIAPLSTERRYPSENAELAKAHTEIFMEIAKPMFAIGLKDLTEFTDPKDRLRHALRFNLLLRLLFSRSSPFYNDLYNRSLVSDALEPLYEFTNSCAYMLIMGESEKPEDVFDEIKKLFSDIPEEMLKEENFLRVKRAMYADNIRLLDSTESIAYEITDAAIHGYNLWDVGTEIQKITLEEIKQLSIEFKDKPLAFAVIRPIGEQ